MKPRTEVLSFQELSATLAVDQEREHLLQQLQSLLTRAQSHEPAARYDEALQDLDVLLAHAREGRATAFEAAALHHRGRVLRIKGELAPPRNPSGRRRTCLLRFKTL